MPLNIGDTIPYGIHIAPTAGSVNKAVKKVMIAPVAGPVNKTVCGIRIAPAAGPVNKRVFIGGGILGDVNNDGEVSVTDYTMIRLHYLGLELLNPEEQNRADVNRDGAVTEADYELVRDYILA
jgi:hypothetical protein